MRSGPKPKTLEQVFSAKISKQDCGCWFWTGKKLPSGYGIYHTLREDGKTKNRYAHRMAWEFFRGPIPKGLQIDHLCRERNCVNPDHLEPVTATVNVRRSLAPAAINAAKTHCIWGHKFTAENTYVHYAKGRPHRMCKTCNAQNQARIRERRRLGLGKYQGADGPQASRYYQNRRPE